MGILSKSCTICHTSLTKRFRNYTLNYKYCPECGANSDISMPTVKYSRKGYLWHSYSALLMPLWAYFITRHSVSQASFMVMAIIVSLGGVFWRRIRSKKCPKCTAYYCKSKHKFCYNCGHKF